MTTCKKITLTAAAMVLSAGLAVGGTLAYLNAVTETKTNTFTSSRNITTTLTETEWTSDSGKNYLPGDVIKKNPVMNNESDQPVYMAVKVDYLDDKGNLMSAEEFKKYATITDYDNDNWKMATVNSDGSEVWIYMTAVEAGESTEALFNNVTVNAGRRQIVYGGAESRATMIIGYLIRLLVMLILFVLLYFLNIGDLLCAVIGMFSMKVAAYLQPFTDKLITKKGR